MKLCSDKTNNNIQFQALHFNRIIPASPHIDLAGNVLFGVPTTWTWIEVPLYTQETGIGYPQFIIKAGSTNGTVYLGEIQIIQAKPSLIDNRGPHWLNYPYRTFLTYSRITKGWGKELLDSSVSGEPVLSVDTFNEILVDYNSATTNTSLGSKFTAKNGQSGIYTPSHTAGRDIGMQLDLNLLYGNFNTYNALLTMICYGVRTDGSYDFLTPPGQIIGQGEIGRLTAGRHYAVGSGRNPYHQFQFSLKNDQPGILSANNIDFLLDQDDLYYGDASLF